MWRPEFLPLLYKDLGIRPGIRAVDVGCGTGFFTRLIAGGMKGHGHVIGLDIDAKLLNHALLLSAGQGFGLLEFKKGDVYTIPLPDRFTDLTVAHMVLHWLKEPVRAVREMRRVTKTGGTVSAIGVDGDVWYDPDNPRLNELDERFDSAFVQGAMDLDGYDLTIARKLPTILEQAGLREIHASCYATLDLVGDSRRSRRERQDRWKESLNATRRSRRSRVRSKRYALAGGMPAREFDERFELRLRKLRKYALDPDAARSDMSLTASLIIVASGKRS